MAWHIAYRKIQPYLVRISTEEGFGTGFIFAFNATRSIAAIATACHVVEPANDWKKPIKLQRYENTRSDPIEETFIEEKRRVILTDSKRDCATILVSSDLLTLPSSTLPLMDPEKYKSIGIEVGWVGFPAIAPNELCFFSGKISSFRLANDCYLIDGVAINGVSGGPVFAELEDSTPEIIGVISAYVPNRRQVGTLPGLLRAQDVTAFDQHIKQLRNFDEAKEKEAETQKKIDESSDGNEEASTSD